MRSLKLHEISYFLTVEDTYTYLCTGYSVIEHHTCTISGTSRKLFMLLSKTIPVPFVISSFLIIECKVKLFYQMGYRDWFYERNVENTLTEWYLDANINVEYVVCPLDNDDGILDCDNV